MALDIEFPTPEEEFKRKTDLVNNAPPMSVEIPSSIEGAIGLTDIQPFEKPLDILPEKQKEQKGFLDSFGHTFNDMEVAAHAVDFAYHKYTQHQVASDLASQNPREEVTPEGWTPLEMQNFQGFPEGYWPFISDSSNPEELQARQQEVTRLMHEEEEYADGSTWGKVLGGTTALVTDAVLFGWIPIANSVRYAKYGQGILKNMARQAPGITASSLAYTTAMDATTTGKTMQDFAIDATVNTLAGIALTGAAAGIGRGLRGGEMYRSRHALKMNFQDIEAVENISKEGVSLGMVARPIAGSAANAMEVTRAQEFLDSRFAKIGFFKIPYVGAGIEKTFKYVSPQFRAFTSEWGPTRSYINRMANHSYITEGINDGKASPVNFEAMMMKYHTGAANLGQQLEGLRHEANGMSPGLGPINASKRLAQRITEGSPQYTKDSWGAEVMDTLFSGESSQVPQANDAVKELEKFYTEHLNEYQKAHGLEQRDLPVKTAAGYLSRRYDTGKMNEMTGTESWNGMCLQYFREGDHLITEAMHPINELESVIEEVKVNIHNGVNAEQNRITLKAYNAQLKNERRELKDKILEDKRLQNLITENVLPREDEAILKAKLKPWKDATKESKNLKTELSSFKRQLANEKRKFESGEKTVGIKAGDSVAKKNYPEIKAKIDELEAAIYEKDAEMAKVNQIVDDHWNQLMDEVESGQIKRSLYYRNEEGGKVTFKKTNTSPKFRTLYSSHGDLAEAEMLQDAKAYHSNITGTNPDKLAQQMESTLQANATGNVLKERSFLIPDQTLLANGFLSTDLNRNAMLYALTLGRKTSHTTALKSFGVSKSGKAGFVEEMTKELDAKKEAIRVSDKTTEKKNKETRKLNKSFKKEIDFVEALDAVAMGTYSRTGHNQNVRDSINAVRSLTAGAKLGSLPFLQIPDFAVQIFKSGVFRWARDGIYPLIKTMNGTIKATGGENFRRNASKANLALESVMHMKADELWHNATEASSSFAGQASDAMSYLARGANKLSGSAFLEDTNQRLIANISQSNLIERLYQYENGTLGKRELTQMLQFGIDPKIQASKILRAFESSPTSYAKKGGGFESSYWDWGDKEARNMMTDNIRKSVSATLIRKGLFDSPLVSNDPVISMLFTFTGWYFAALNRFMLPALQAPLDHYLMSGSVATFGLSLMIDPLRAWSRGEEFNMDDEAWFGSAIGDVPPLAPLYSAAMRGNAIIDNDFLSKIKNDRYRNLSILGGAGGAPVGVAENIAKGVRMFATQNWNQADIKRLANTVPAAQMWWMNSWKNQFMDSLTDGLPRTYQSAKK